MAEATVELTVADHDDRGGSPLDQDRFEPEHDVGGLARMAARAENGRAGSSVSANTGCSKNSSDILRS
jgi:hypothetical protein